MIFCVSRFWHLWGETKKAPAEKAGAFINSIFLKNYPPQEPELQEPELQPPPPIGFVEVMEKPDR